LDILASQRDENLKS